MEDFQGKYDGNQIDSRLDKVKDMVGATASGAGAAGLVPAPAAEKRTAFLRGDPVGDNRTINFSTAGTGTKALMDDGTYKEIGSSGVDISSYILEGIDFKKNTTKEGFDKIKSCIINKQHMYVYYKVEMGGDVAAFTSDVIANFLYGNISLVMVESSNIELKQVVINSSDYNITVTKI